MANPEVLVRSEYSDLSPLEIIRSEKKVRRIETIPVEKIIQDTAIIDDFHATQLGESMAGEDGQMSPIAVWAREKNGEVVYEVIDGFHRTEAMSRIGQKTIEAVVKYGITTEKLYTLRILAANSVKSVKFSRLALWMEKAYEETPWKAKGLTIQQVFGLAVTDRETSYLNLSKEELKNVKEWANKSARSWQTSVANILSVLRIVANADPELVKKVRESSGGKDRTGRITPARLEMTAMALPKNYPAQNALLEYAVEERLTAEETSNLARQLALAIEDVPEGDIDYEEIIYKIVEMNQREYEDEVGPSEQDLEEIGETEEDEGPINIAPYLRTDEEDNQEEGPTAEDLAEIEAEEKGAPRKSTNKRYPSSGAGYIIGLGHKGSDPYSPSDNNSETVKDLRKALKRTHEILERREGEGDWQWWQTAPYLTPGERAVMVESFDNGQSPEDVAEILSIPELRVQALIRSATTKHKHKFEEEKKSKDEEEPRQEEGVAEELISN